MRCKAGDLAVVVNDPESPRNNGKLVKIEGRADDNEAPFDWECTPLSTMYFLVGGRVDAGEVGCALFRDSELRPLRDPGDDVRDETLDWLPVPAKEAENAL